MESLEEVPFGELVDRFYQLNRWACVNTGNTYIVRYMKAICDELGDRL